MLRAIAILALAALYQATCAGQSATTPGPRADRGGCTDTGRLWRAICWQESRNNPSAYNPAEQAAGIAQIRPICLRDCNRIVGYKRWTLADRYSPTKAREMFEVYTGHYMRHYRLDGPEAAARIWNAGPRGWEKECSVAYWRNIQRQLTMQEGK